MEDWAKRLNGKMAGFTEPVTGAAPVLSGVGKVAAGLWWALGAVAAAAAVAGIVVLSRPEVNAPTVEISAPMIVQEQYSEEVVPDRMLSEQPVKNNPEKVPDTVQAVLVNPVFRQITEVAEEQSQDDVLDKNPDTETMDEIAWPINWENPVVGKRRHFEVSLFAHLAGRMASYQNVNDSPAVEDNTAIPPVSNDDVSDTVYGDIRDDYLGDSPPPDGDEDQNTKADTDSDNQAGADPVPAPMMHRLPLHIGVRVSTEIGYRINLETGLDYARFVSTDGNVEQRLHYIGVPVRLRYDVLDAKYYSAGVSLGAEAMKCVAGNGPDKPWLFDIGASLDAEWKITPLMGLYAEMGIGRYFHTGETQHYYTLNPVSVSFSVGLRFEL